MALNVITPDSTDDQHQAYIDHVRALGDFHGWSLVRRSHRTGAYIWQHPDYPHRLMATPFWEGVPAVFIHTINGDKITTVPAWETGCLFLADRAYRCIVGEHIRMLINDGTLPNTIDQP